MFIYEETAEKEISIFRKEGPTEEIYINPSVRIQCIMTVICRR